MLQFDLGFDVGQLLMQHLCQVPECGLFTLCDAFNSND